MSVISDELFEIANRLETPKARSDLPEIKEPLTRLENAADEVGESWSGSWLGYHSRVYYRNLQPPPPRAHFSQEYGLMELPYSPLTGGTVGDWVEYTYNDVERAIHERVGNPDLTPIEEFAKSARDLFEASREEVISQLTTALVEQEDSFLSRLLKETEKLTVYDSTDFVTSMRPSGELGTRDRVVFGQGIQTPPHIAVMSEIVALRSPGVACGELAKVARRAASHLAKQERYLRRNQEIGTNVFIGHGRSPVWRDLKDFVQDRLNLPCDEFNRVPVAGITNIARLSQMLDDAAIAFLVMTAEDEQADGKMRARENVVHEAGLFQGKLGFSKAIVLLEEDCEPFSNIEGLGQIRFPKGDIRPAFEEIRRVLEREGLIEPR